jgi:hypothetical protein
VLLPTKDKHDNSRACRHLTGMGFRLQNIVLLRSSSALSQAFILFLFQRCKCIFITSLKQGDLQWANADVEKLRAPNSLALLGIHKINLDLIDAIFLFLPMCGVDNIFSCVAWTTLLWRKTKCRCLHRLMKLHLDLLSSRLPRLLPFRYVSLSFLRFWLRGVEQTYRHESCMSLYLVLSRFWRRWKTLSSPFAEGRPTVDGDLWHHTLAYGPAMRQDFFSGRVRQSSLLQRAQYAQGSDLFIS